MLIPPRMLLPGVLCAFLVSGSVRAEVPAACPQIPSEPDNWFFGAEDRKTTRMTKLLSVWGGDETSDGVARPSAGQTEAVTCMSWAGRGRYLVTGDSNGRITIRETVSGKVMRSWVAHDGPVSAVTDVRGGSDVVVSAGRDMTDDGWQTRLKKWDAKRTKVLATTEVGSRVESLDVSPRGPKTVLASSAIETVLWSLTPEGGRRQIGDPALPLGKTVFSGGALYGLAGGCDGVLRHMDISEGKTMRSMTWEVAGVDAVWDALKFLSFNTGEDIVVASQSITHVIPFRGTGVIVGLARYDDKSYRRTVVQLWDLNRLESPKWLWETRHARLTSLALAANRRYLVGTHSNRDVVIYDLESGKVVDNYVMNRSPLGSLVAPGGEYMLVGTQGGKVVKRGLTDKPVADDNSPSGEHGNPTVSIRIIGPPVVALKPLPGIFEVAMAVTGVGEGFEETWTPFVEFSSGYELVIGRGAGDPQVGIVGDGPSRVIIYRWMYKPIEAGNVSLRAGVRAEEGATIFGESAALYIADSPDAAPRIAVAGVPAEVTVGSRYRIKVDLANAGGSVMSMGGSSIEIIRGASSVFVSENPEAQYGTSMTWACTALQTGPVEMRVCVHLDSGVPVCSEPFETLISAEEVVGGG